MERALEWLLTAVSARMGLCLCRPALSLHEPDLQAIDRWATGLNLSCSRSASLSRAMGSLIKKRRKRMRKKKHKKMLKRTRWARRAK